MKEFDNYTTLLFNGQEDFYEDYEKYVEPDTYEYYIIVKGSFVFTFPAS